MATEPNTSPTTPASVDQSWVIAQVGPWQVFRRDGVEAWLRDMKRDLPQMAELYRFKPAGDAH